MVLLIIGAVIFVWRKRRSSKSEHRVEDDGVADDVIHHGKPELAGSDPTKFSQTPTFVMEKSELDNSIAWTGSSQIQPVEIGHYTAPSAELTADSSHKQAYPPFTELPASVSRNSSSTSPTTRTNAAGSQSQSHKSPSASAERPSSLPQRDTSELGTSTRRSHNNDHTSNNTNIDSHENVETYRNDATDDGGINVLRQQERELAESIFAAENLARLKSEQRALQEKIRQFEEGGRVVGKNG